MNERARYDRALDRARMAAFEPGEFVGQESFMRADEILKLAVRAGIGSGTAVLDLCCGVAGPGRFIARRLGCSYLGVDADPDAIGVARDRAEGLDCRFDVARIPPVPDGRYDAVLLFETMLAFPDKESLLGEVAAVLNRNGRFVFTLEEGEPLTPGERERMPAADTVHLTPLPDLLASVNRAGLTVRRLDDVSRSHRIVAESLRDAFVADAEDIAAQLGRDTLDHLLASHELWSDWLRRGRTRKFTLIAEKTD